MENHDSMNRLVWINKEENNTPGDGKLSSTAQEGWIYNARKGGGPIFSTTTWGW